MDHDSSQRDAMAAPFWRSRYAIGLVVLGAIATYFLVSEHRAHFLGALPLLLLLSCPLMHVFMHHGHGGPGADHASHGGGSNSASSGPAGSGSQP